MIGVSRVSIQELRGLSVSPRSALSASQERTISTITFPSGRAFLRAEWDMSNAERTDTSKQSTIIHEYSTDGGTNWIFAGSATTKGSPNQVLTSPPWAEWRPAPPVGSLVRTRLVAGNSAVNCGVVVR